MPSILSDRTGGGGGVVEIEFSVALKSSLLSACPDFSSLSTKNMES